MKIWQKQARYYYWLFTGFFKKYSKIVIAVFVAAFFLLFVLRSFADNFLYLLNPNRQKVGLLIFGNKQQIPLEILQKISQPIVYFDSKGELKPNLSESWQMEKDAKEFVFNFSKKLVWQDGTPFDLNEVNFESFNLKNIQMKIENPHRIRFILKEPLVNFPNLLTLPLVKNNFVGINGDYRLSRLNYKAGELKSLTLVPLTSGLPLLFYRFYYSTEDLVLSYKLGDIDLFTTTDLDIGKLFSSWRNTKVVEAVDYKKIVTIFINMEKAPLDNKNLRQALAQLIDYPSLKTFGIRTASLIAPFSWAFSPDLKQYSFEAEIGKSLLEKNSALGKEITISAPYELNQIAEKVNQSLNEAGLKSEIRYVVYIPQNYDLFLTIWEPGIDPDQYVFWHQSQKGTNLSNLKNIKIDKVLEDGRRELSKTKRKQIYLKFQELIMDEVPAIFLYHPKLFIVERKKWRNLL